MLGQVAREAQQGIHQSKELVGHFRIAGEVFVENLLAPVAGLVPPIDAFQKLFHHGGIKTQGFAHIPDGAARPVADHRGGQGCAFPAVTPVDVLDNLFPPFMLEIHINIGWLSAILGDEAFEQQLHASRVDLGDAQAVAHGRVGSRPAALAQNAFAAGEGDNILDSEEVVLVLHL